MGHTTPTTPRILSVVGARPQFVKAAAISRALAEEGLQETLIHTGQHYDRALSQEIFEDLGLSPPDLNLAVGSDSHTRQTARMMMALEDTFARFLVPNAPKPTVLVYGDTNSTLAAALTASQMGLPLVHVEAGLRSGDRSMPEETNRILTDQLSHWLYCPTPKAVDNLQKEKLKSRAILTGDVMCDALLHHRKQALQTTLGQHLSGAQNAPQKAASLIGLPQKHAHLLTPGAYRVATIHRAHNTNHPKRLQHILRAIADPSKPTLLLIHPRTARIIEENHLSLPTKGLHVLPPARYLHTLALVQHAHQLLTDSGGLQKESLLLETPCITLRDSTEWTETLDTGWNTLVGSRPESIQEAMNTSRPQGSPPPLYGDGNASRIIAQHLKTLSTP